MTSANINFFTEDTSFIFANDELVSTWLTKVADHEKQEIRNLNYVFCSDEYLLGINQKYLNHDYYTDIISFPLSSEVIEGDIFISVDRVTENASKNKVNFENELYRVMVHGLLHFLGYKDKTQEESITMRTLENKYLELITPI